MSILGALRNEDYETPLGVSSVSTNCGMGLEAAGMYQILKVIQGQKYGVQVPGLHLNELNMHIDVWSGDEPLSFTTENVSNTELSSFVGMTSRSLGGTQVHIITFCLVDTEERRPQRKRMERDAVLFWPAGGGELPEEAEPSSSRPYSILGSWSDWEYAEPMTSEGDGVYGYTVTLGEERWESFQILLDGDWNQVLHPSISQFDGGWMSPPAANVIGPNPREVCEEFAWVIDGRDQMVAMVDTSAETSTALQDADAAPVEPELRPNPYRQPSEQGSQFRVRLRVSGKFRYVEWQRLEDTRGS